MYTQDDMERRVENDKHKQRPPDHPKVYKPVLPDPVEFEGLEDYDEDDRESPNSATI